MNDLMRIMCFIVSFVVEFLLLNKVKLFGLLDEIYFCYKFSKFVCHHLVTASYSEDGDLSH